MEEAIDSMGDMASAVGRGVDALNRGLSINISEFSGPSGENYFLGLVQMQEHIAKAQYEAARIQAQANTIALIKQLGLEFNRSGGMNDKDEDRLVKALRLVKANAEVLHPDVDL